MFLGFDKDLTIVMSHHQHCQYCQIFNIVNIVAKNVVIASHSASIDVSIFDIFQMRRWRRAGRALRTVGIIAKAGQSDLSRFFHDHISS